MRLLFRHRLIYGFAASLVLLVLACNPARRMTRTADKLYLSGYFDDASGFYYNALLRKPGYAKAMDGLKLSAQHVLDQKFETFHKQVIGCQLEAAVKQYRYAVQFNANSLSVGVQLTWPEEYDEIYRETLNEYTGSLFDEVLALISEKKFDQAERKLQQLAGLDTTFRGVTVLRMPTVLEPVYNKALDYYRAGQYNEALPLFHKIAAIDPGFKDVQAMKQASFEKSTRKAGIWMEGGDNPVSGGEKLVAKLKSTQPEQLRFVGAGELRQLLESRGWKSVNGDSNAIQAGRSAGLHYLLLVFARTIADSSIPRKTEMREAYEAFTENIPNPYTDTYSYITRFKKITYADVYESRVVRISATCLLVSCINGEVLLRDRITAERTHESHQFMYDGNISNLYRELPTDNFLPPPDYDWRALFRKKGSTATISGEKLSKLVEEEWSEKVQNAFIQAIK